MIMIATSEGRRATTQRTQTIDRADFMTIEECPVIPTQLVKKSGDAMNGKCCNKMRWRA